MLAAVSNFPVAEATALSVASANQQDQWIPNLDHQWMILANAGMALEKAMWGAVGELTTTFADEAAETFGRHLEQLFVEKDTQGTPEDVFPLVSIECFAKGSVTIELNERMVGSLMGGL